MTASQRGAEQPADEDELRYARAQDLVSMLEHAGYRILREDGSALGEQGASDVFALLAGWIADLEPIENDR